MMSKSNKRTFRELARAKIQESRIAVVSENGHGEITIGQAVQIQEGSRRTEVFMKGAFFIDKDKLFDFRDALNEAIRKLEEEDDPS